MSEPGFVGLSGNKKKEKRGAATLYFNASGMYTSNNFPASLLLTTNRMGLPVIAEEIERFIQT